MFHRETDSIASTSLEEERSAEAYIFAPAARRRPGALGLRGTVSVRGSSRPGNRTAEGETGDATGVQPGSVRADAVPAVRAQRIDAAGDLARGMGDVWRLSGG